MTASEHTWTPQSRSSSYHTASECRGSPWDSEKNSEIDFDSSLRLLPEGISSASNSFDDSETSFVTASFLRSDSDDVQTVVKSSPVLSKESSLEEESSSSTISQSSRPDTNSVLRNPPVFSQMDANNNLNGNCEESKKVSSSEDEHADFINWNSYYHSLISKHTIKSCL